MSQCVVQSSNPTWSYERRFHQFQVMIPQTCEAESRKVTNLRNQIRELESHLVEFEKLADWMEFLSTGKLFASFIAETCIGFLDLAASILSAIPKMDGAEQVAKSGLAAVTFSKNASQYRSGQISVYQFGQRTTSSILSTASPESLANKALLHQAQTAVGAVGVALNQSGGVDYAHSELSGNFGLATEALASDLGDNAKSVRIMKGISAFDGMVTTALNYQNELDRIFTERLNEKQQNQDWIVGMRQNTKATISTLTQKLNSAIIDLNDCLSEANKAPMSVAS